MITEWLMSLGGSRRLDAVLDTRRDPNLRMPPAALPKNGTQGLNSGFMPEA